MGSEAKEVWKGMGDLVNVQKGGAEVDEDLALLKYLPETSNSRKQILKELLQCFVRPGEASALRRRKKNVNRTVTGTCTWEVVWNMTLQTSVEVVEDMYKTTST